MEAPSEDTKISHEESELPHNPRSISLAVVGSRDFSNYALLAKSIRDLKAKEGVVIEEVVSGGARGADRLAEKYARSEQIALRVFLPQWDTHGKAAGVIRNKLIVDRADMVLAFWDGKSAGTQSTIQLAKRAGKEVLVVDYTKVP